MKYCGMGLVNHGWKSPVYARNLEQTQEALADDVPVRDDCLLCLFFGTDDVPGPFVLKHSTQTLGFKFSHLEALYEHKSLLGVKRNRSIIFNSRNELCCRP